jgi:hypothetical protein
MFDLVTMIGKLKEREAELQEQQKKDLEASFMEAASKFRI